MHVLAEEWAHFWPRLTPRESGAGFFALAIISLSKWRGCEGLEE